MENRDSENACKCHATHDRSGNAQPTSLLPHCIAHCHVLRDLTSIRRMFAIKGEHFLTYHGVARERRYVNAMAWNELTTSSGPASVKKHS